MKIKSFVVFHLLIIFFSAGAWARDEYQVSVPLREPVLLYRISTPESGRYTPEQIKSSFEGRKSRNRLLRLLGTEEEKEWSESLESAFPLHPQAGDEELDRVLQILALGKSFSGVFVSTGLSVPITVRLQASQDGVDLFVQDHLGSDWWNQSENVNRVIVGDELKIMSTNELDRLRKSFPKQWSKGVNELQEFRMVKTNEVLSAWFQNIQSKVSPGEQCLVKNELKAECMVRFECLVDGEWKVQKKEKGPIPPGKELRFPLQEIFPEGEKCRCRASLSERFSECEVCWSHEFSRDSIEGSGGPVLIKIRKPEVRVKRPRIVDESKQKEVHDRTLMYSIRKRDERKRWDPKDNPKCFPLHEDIYLYVGSASEKACFSTNFVCGSDKVRTIPDIPIPSSSKSMDNSKPVEQGNSRKISEKVIPNLRNPSGKNKSDPNPDARDCEAKRANLKERMVCLLDKPVEWFWVPFVLLQTDNLRVGEQAKDLEWLCEHDGKQGTPYQHIHLELIEIFGENNAAKIEKDVLTCQFKQDDLNFKMILNIGDEEKHPLAALFWNRWEGNLEKLDPVFTELDLEKEWKKWQKTLFRTPFDHVLSEGPDSSWVKLVKEMNDVKSTNATAGDNRFPGRALGLWFLYCDKNPRGMFNTKMQSLGLTQKQCQTINGFLY